jgi:hypothetical protein
MTYYRPNHYRIIRSRWSRHTSWRDFFAVSTRDQLDTAFERAGACAAAGAALNLILVGFNLFPADAALDALGFGIFAYLLLTKRSRVITFAALCFYIAEMVGTSYLDGDHGVPRGGIAVLFFIAVYFQAFRASLRWDALVRKPQAALMALDAEPPPPVVQETV